MGFKQPGVEEGCKERRVEHCTVMDRGSDPRGGEDSPAFIPVFRPEWW